jgi:type I restriction enzyme R subunit
MKKGRENEETFGFEPKKEMPFFGLLKKELYGEKTIDELSKDDIDLLIDLTQNILSIIKENVKVVDFWENYSKQKQVKSYIISNILLPNDNRNNLIYNRRNEIVQKIMELAYHLYGKRQFKFSN